MSPISSLGSIARASSVITLIGLVSACYAVAGAEPVYVDAPVAYEMAPQYAYEGRTVYYVNDHWYARGRGGWVYYRSEPAPLARYRLQIQSAPRAPARAREMAEPRRELAPRALHERRQAAPQARPEHNEDRPSPERERHQAAPRAGREHGDRPNADHKD